MLVLRKVVIQLGGYSVEIGATEPAKNPACIECARLANPSPGENTHAVQLAPVKVEALHHLTLGPETTLALELPRVHVVSLHAQ